VPGGAGWRLAAGRPAFPGLLAAFLAVALALGPAAGLRGEASVYVLYPANLTLQPVEPPVVLSASNDGEYVSTSLGPAGASANVTVSLPGGYAIGLASRAAVYWSSFDSNPFASGDLYVLNPDPACSWSWSSQGYVSVAATGTAGSEGGECIALVNRTATISQRIWVNYVFRIDSGSGYADIVLRESAEPGRAFYTISAFEISDYDRYGNDYAQIYLYNGNSWSLLSSSRVSIYRGVWYDMTAYRDDSTGEAALYSGTNLVVSATDTSVDVGSVGLGVYYSADTFQVDFDMLLVTVGASPYYVNVTGLQPGWYVRILDSNNNVLASATASGDTVSLEAWQWKFAPNATIEVYTDSSMSTLVARATFEWVVGGDLYRVSQPSTGVTLNLVNANNTLAGVDFNASMRLDAYETVAGSFSNISVWLESPSGPETSTPIVVSYGRVVSGETSWVGLPGQYQVRAYIHVEGDPGSVAVLNLTLRYTLQGAVTVEYPVNVEVEVSG